MAQLGIPVALGEGRFVLAVSGGLDSMALLHAAAHTVHSQIAAVASFDHRTGPAATAAISLVSSYSSFLGIPAVLGRSPSPSHQTEAGWRAERWQFLREVAGRYSARVATAHTKDDQVETVVMRILRGSGTRGLAGLYADSEIARPFVERSRAEIAEYVRAHRVPFIDDPSNASRAHLRNRVRLDLLPALRAVRPGFDDEMLDLGRRAAVWRAAVEQVVCERVALRETDDGYAVAASQLAGYDPESLGVLWPAIAARAGVTLDRRGTSRLVTFTNGGRVGARVQVAGGVEVVRTKLLFVLRALAR